MQRWDIGHRHAAYLRFHLQQHNLSRFPMRRTELLRPPHGYLRRDDAPNQLTSQQPVAKRIAQFPLHHPRQRHRHPDHLGARRNRYQLMGDTGPENDQLARQDCLKPSPEKIPQPPIHEVIQLNICVRMCGHHAPGSALPNAIPQRAPVSFRDNFSHKRDDPILRAWYLRRMTTAKKLFPQIDATQQDCITADQAQFFLENGLLVIRNVLRGAELKALQDETLPLVQRAMSERMRDPDFLYMNHPLTGRETPFRVEYIIDKTRAAKALLGHPFILRSVEKLQGPNFIPTWDSMVFKTEGAGAAILWHRDAGDDCVADTPIFNVDFYLDEADLSNCLWGILGSHRWSTPLAHARITALNEGGFKTDADCVPIPMQPGDVIFHNILVLHGSPPAQTKLRRVIYFEFRSAETERAKGPHVPEYIPLKQRMLRACLRHRAQTPYATGEKPFTYNPTPEFIPPPLAADEELPTYRYPHHQFWRKTT